MNIDIPRDDRVALLLTAREAIAARFRDRRAAWPEYGVIAEERLGAFVTLHETAGSGRRNLRGCIGRMSSELPLRSTIRDMAIAAAFEDPRFPALREGELEAVDIEISVLSPFEPCAPDDVIPGVHGVYLTRGYRSGVFLPQVAPEQGWDRQQLLEHLCGKAGLESGAYAAPEARLFRFTATVFGEMDR